MIEGIVLEVCSECEKFSKPLRGEEKITEAPQIARRLEIRRKRSRTRDVFEEETLDLVFDYPSRIRRARSQKGWSQKELGRKINEKWSVINKLEKGRMRPDDELVGKLERALGIKLKEKIEEVKVRKASVERPMTLADLLKRED